MRLRTLSAPLLSILSTLVPLRGAPAHAKAAGSSFRGLAFSPLIPPLFRRAAVSRGPLRMAGIKHVYREVMNRLPE